MFLSPEVIQSDGFHCTVVTKFASEHFLQHVNQVDVVHYVHGIVVVKVKKHNLHHMKNPLLHIENLHIHRRSNASLHKIMSLKIFLTSFSCLLKKMFISDKPSLTFGREQSLYVKMYQQV